MKKKLSAVMGEALSVHYSGGATLNEEISQWLDTNGIVHEWEAA